MQATAEAQRARKRAARPPARKQSLQATRPRAPFTTQRYSLGGTGLEPRTSVLLSDPVMLRLRAAARNFMEAPTPLQRDELRRFAERNPGHQAASLAYLALGYQALNANDSSEAAANFQAGRRINSPVPDYLEYYHALALFRLRQFRDAIAQLDGYEQRHAYSSLVGMAVLLRAEALIESGQAPAAIEMLRTRLGALARPAADLLLGRAMARSGRTTEAIEALRLAYYLYPASEEAGAAAKEIAQLQASGATAPPVAASLRSERAEKLFTARRFRAAQDAFTEMASVVTGAEREQALVSAAGSAYRAGSTSAAFRLLSTLAPADPEADAERLYYLAECYRRMKRGSDFAATIRRLAEKFPSSAWYEEALLSAGNSALLDRDWPQMVQHYRTLYERFPQGRNAPLAHWRTAWRAYRSGDFEAARQMFEQQVLRFPQSTQAASALYWLGRLSETSAPATAAAYFRKAADHYPQYFYGTISRERLSDAARLQPAAGAAQLPDNVTRVLAAVPVFRPSLAGMAPPPDLAAHRRKVEALEAAWLLDLALVELRHQTEDAAHAQYLALELARLERDRGRFLQAIEQVRRVFPNYFAYSLNDLDRSTWEVLFPLPWFSLVKSVAGRHGLDPYLVMALMRQESAFNRWAVSHANAYGLMQLLPSTARVLARKLGMPRPSTVALFDPETNVELGTQYLRDVLDRFGGRVEEALASYNAGPHRVDTWHAQDDFRDAAEFVESIPFTETREYVQAVLRNASLYRRLYPK